MADQSVRACHPSKFYYFRRSLLISCCYILPPFTAQPLLPSLFSPSRIPITLPSPFTPFSLSFSRSARLAPSSSTSFHLLVISLLFTLRPVPSSTPGETREKDKRGRERERKNSTSVLLSAREIKQRRNLEHVCSGFAAALPLRAALLYSKFIPFCLLLPFLRDFSPLSRSWLRLEM